MVVPLSRMLILSIPVLAGGFFSLVVEALYLARKTRLLLRPERPSPLILDAALNPGPFLFALNIWRLLAFLALGILAALFLGGALPALIILALAAVVLFEFLPALIAGKAAEAVLCILFPLAALVSLPWKPLYFLVQRFSGSPPLQDSGDEEIRIALEEGEKSGAVESEERTMVEGVLYLGDRPVSAFMTHRSEIEWLDIAAGAAEAREKALTFRGQGFFPVVRGTQDNIAGVVSVQDILFALTEPGGGGWKGLPAIMKTPRFIPETMSALRAFEAFRREDEYYLCVVDEYGGFAGSLRVRDLVEEIVGELTGSPSQEEPILSQEDGTWLADGNISIDELAETLKLEDLGEENPRDYHTLAGFILKLAGEIPRTGDSFDWEGFRFKVVDKDGNRIDKVLISKSGAAPKAVPAP